MKPLLKEIKATIKNSQKVAGQFLSYLPVSSAIIGPPKGFHYSTIDWLAGENSCSLDKNYIEIYPSHWIYRQEPKTIGNKVDWRFLKGYLGSKFQTPAAFIVQIPNARIYGDSGAVITSDDRLLADVSIEFGVWPERAKNHSIFRRLKLPNISKIDQTVAVLATAGGNNYFHWMFDILPRIHLLNQSGMFEDVEKFLVNKVTTLYQKETLSFLGISQERIIELDRNSHFQVSKLVLPSLPGTTGSMTGWTCDFIRKEILLKIDIKKKITRERVYISRGDATYRRVLNEDELIDLLLKLDFKVYTLKGLSITEQATIFNSADVIVSAHGAGLSNLVFCSPGCKLVELFHPNYVNPCFRALCNLVGVEYWYLLGEGNPPPEHHDAHLLVSGEEDVRINTGLLAELLETSGVCS